MKKTNRSTGKNKNIIACIGIGVLAALIISLSATAGLTSLIEKGRLSENEFLFIFLIRLVATTLGGLIGTGLAGDKLLPVITGVSVVYLVTLLGMGILMLDGTVHQFWPGLLSVIIGSSISLFIKLKTLTPKKKVMRFAK